MNEMYLLKLASKMGDKVTLEFKVEGMRISCDGITYQMFSYYEEDLINAIIFIKAKLMSEKL